MGLEIQPVHSKGDQVVVTINILEIMATYGTLITSQLLLMAKLTYLILMKLRVELLLTAVNIVDYVLPIALSWLLLKKVT